MSKLVRKIFCLLVIFLLAAGTSLALAEESSIDSVDQGVAATGESKADKSKPITECRTPYSVAVLPYVDASGLEGRSREMAANAVKVPAGAANMRSSQLLDGKVWDGSDPAGYARSFALHAMSTRAPLAARR